jgi:hypothetical protein
MGAPTATFQPELDAANGKSVSCLIDRILGPSCPEFLRGAVTQVSLQPDHYLAGINGPIGQS